MIHFLKTATLTNTLIPIKKQPKCLTEALLYKADAPHRQRALAADAATCRKLAERAYKYRPLKVVEFDRPYPQCIAEYTWI
jgi:hypothetical protein